MFHKELERSELDRFERHMGSGGGGECWEWLGPKDIHGYGIFSVGRKLYKAHRASFFMHNGFIDAKLMCCHSCDNPGCVNPAHLWLGTQRDNSLDRHRKGRTKTGQLHGEKNPIAKLTNDEVLWIRTNYNPKIWSTRKLAKKFGVCQTKIRHILIGESWKHVQG